ncbi:MAG: flagellar basal body L-ring protein FlgH [Phycisphaerales bacterium]|nr:flagellar basal body L-ring protein FlgH [Phycisphaerales bacterium]
MKQVLLSALAIALCVSVVEAQSNSPYSRAKRSNANQAQAGATSNASQQANGQRSMPIPRPSTAGADAPPPPNPALLRWSLIAVEAPPPRKFKVNDLVTVIVREDKRASSDSKLESSKDWTLQAELKRWFRLDKDARLVESPLRGNPGVDFNFKNDYSGEGKVDRRDSLITRLTTRILDVKPNGNLVLEARKEVVNDEEREVVTLTGECRSDDVTAQNTVLSTQIFGLSIQSQHNGAARDAARRGWMMKALDWARPF